MQKGLIFIYLIFPIIFSCNIENTSYEDILNNQIRTGGFNGNVIVIENGKTVLKRAHGISNIHKGDSLVTNSVFRLGSVSKQFTAMAITILKDKGKLSYDQDVKEFIPNFPYNGVTIKHLLHHTSGLPDYLNLMVEHWKTEYKEDEPLRYISGNEDIIQKIIEKKPEILFRPGEKWEYSNTGYVLLATIAERVSGKSFDKFLNEMIFSPLGMTNTSVYNFKKEEDPDMPMRVFGFKETPNGRVSNDVHFLNFAKGDGGIYSTLDDLLSWHRSLRDNKLISKATLKEIFTEGKLNNGEHIDYGLGWFIGEEKNNHKVVYHGGGWVGFGTYIYRDVTNDSVFIILTNNSSWDDVKALVEEFKELISS